MSRGSWACAGMRSAGGQLLERAQQTGWVRSDVTVSVIALALGLAWAAELRVHPSRPARPPLVP
ncbi:hypothetical protein AB0O67_35935 [Streptomyces sp. NPDC086077]|uniref:SbtR family transcriptional regulator n=1 Tax=Streptomyces sp. NPDC086077 TaxID=3154862 RepID=UPI003415F1A5